VLLKELVKKLTRFYFIKKNIYKLIIKVIIEGMEWLIDKILDNYENISKRVEQALKKLRERQAQERLERQHRLAIMLIN
jgi:hypothetical protein